MLRGTFQLDEVLISCYGKFIFTSSNWYQRAQNGNFIFLKCAFGDVIMRVNAAIFWRVLFRSLPQKGFTPKEKRLRINLITISINYMLTPIYAIIFNASARKRTNYLADSLWGNQKSLKWFQQSAKNCPCAKLKLLQTFFLVRKTQICWLVLMSRLCRRVSLPCQPTDNNFVPNASPKKWKKVIRWKKWP